MNASFAPQEAARYRYHEALAKLPSCPSSAYGWTGTAYRAVHDPVTPENFLPMAITDHDRFGKIRKDSKKCQAWGLSMYESPDQIQAMLKHVQNRSPLIRKKIGTHCVALNLTPHHGRRTKSDYTGHFTFFEFQSVSIDALGGSPVEVP